MSIQLDINKLIEDAIERYFKQTYPDIRVDSFETKIVMTISKESIINRALANIRAMLLSSYPVIKVERVGDDIVIEIPKELIISQINMVLGGKG